MVNKKKEYNKKADFFIQTEERVVRSHPETGTEIRTIRKIIAAYEQNGIYYNYVTDISIQKGDIFQGGFPDVNTLPKFTSSDPEYTKRYIR